MIPTRYKSKIPKTRSYPLGAKAISDALTGVPQGDLLRINFQFWKGFAKDRVTGAPYRVLSASYVASSLPFDGWTVDVHAVPRPLKHVIKAKLVAEALPKIRDWLILNNHSSERAGGHRLTWYFNELENELTSEDYSSSEWSTERA